MKLSKRTRFVSALGVVAVAIVAGTTYASAIVGGQPATVFMSSTGTIRLDHHDGNGPEFRCGGTLVAKFSDRQSVRLAAAQAGVTASASQMDSVVGTSWVETNAHCIDPIDTLSTTPFPASDLYVGLGSNNRSAQTVYQVAEVNPHPWWNWGITDGPQGQVADIALLKLNTVVPEQPSWVLPVHTGAQVTELGWGLTTPDASGDPPDALQQLNVRVIPANQCAAADPPISTGELCTSNPDSHGPCFGDSGTGLALPGPFVTGSTSRGVGDDSGQCAIAPSVYTSMWYYYVWIWSTITGSITHDPLVVYTVPNAVHNARYQRLYTEWRLTLHV